MTTLDLVIAPDQRLKTVAENIKTVDQSIVKLMNDMSETMEENNGIGLAANQVGVLKRVIVIKIQVQGLTQERKITIQ